MIKNVHHRLGFAIGILKGLQIHLSATTPDITLIREIIRKALEEIDKEEKLTS